MYTPGSGGSSNSDKNACVFNMTYNGICKCIPLSSYLFIIFSPFIPLLSFVLSPPVRIDKRSERCLCSSGSRFVSFFAFFLFFSSSPWSSPYSSLNYSLHILAVAIYRAPLPSTTVFPVGPNSIDLQVLSRPPSLYLSLPLPPDNEYIYNLFDSFLTPIGCTPAVPC